MGDRAERHLRAVAAGNVDLRQRGRVFLELGLDAEDDLVLVGRGVHRRDLALAERAVQRLVDQRQRDPEARGGIAIDLDADIGRGDLLVRGDVLQFRQLLHRRLDDRRPMVQLVGIGVGQRVLILRAAEPAADADVLPRLHKEFGAFDLRHLRPQPADHVVGRDVALVVRLELDEHPAGVLGRIAAARSAEIEHPRDGRILARDFGEAVQHPRHFLEGRILPRFRLAEDEAGILLREKALRDRDVEVSGQNHQPQRREQRR